MSDSSSWFARKLGLPQAPPQQQQAYTQQPPAPPPQQWQTNPQYQGPMPQNAPVQEPADPSTVGQAYLNAYKGKQAGVTFLDVANQWRGDRKKGAAKHEPYSCPECGGNNFFTRQSLKSTRIPGMQPAPLCMDCGYNGMFEQYGTTAIPDTEHE